MSTTLKQRLFCVFLFSTATVVPAAVTEQTNSLSIVTEQTSPITSTPSVKIAADTSKPGTSPLTKMTSTTTTSTTTPTTTITPPTTTEPTCSSLPIPEDGDINYSSVDEDSHPLGTTATYSCQSGYRLNGTANRTCTNEGWNGTLLICSAIDCGRPPNITHGKSKFNSTEVNSTTSYQCDNGYMANGTETIMCGIDGNWTTLRLTCELINCGRPPNITHGKSKFNSTEVNSTTSYQCDNGYMANGTETIMCGIDGNWTTLRLTCELIKNNHTGICLAAGPKEQCSTINSFCEKTIDGEFRCICKDADYYHKANNSCYTRPVAPTSIVIYIFDESISETELSISWTRSKQNYPNNFNAFLVWSPASENGESNTSIPWVRNKDQKTTITGLRSGSMYRFCIYLWDNTIQQRTVLQDSVSVYTRPLPPENLTTVTVLENSVKLQWWINESYIFDKLILQYKANIESEFEMKYFNKTSNPEYEVDNLTSGIEYEFSLYSATNGTNTWSGEAVSIYVYTTSVCLQENSQTVPSRPPDPYFLERTDTTITIQFPYDSNNYEGYMINDTFYERKNTDGNETLVITDLTPGEEFSFTIFTVVNNIIISFENVTFNSFTLPAPPDEAYFPLDYLHETNLTVEWNDTTKGHFDGYELQLVHGNMNINTSNASSDTTAQFSNLTAGQEYTVVIYSYWKGYLSYNSKTLITYTRPSAPNVKLIGVNKTSFTFSIEGDLPIDGYKCNITTSNDDGQTQTFNFKKTDENIYTVDKLTAGTLYNIDVYAKIGAIVGETPYSLQSYTEPNSVDKNNITVDTTLTNSSMLAITWSKPNGDVDWYGLSFSCVSPNNPQSLEIKFNETSKEEKSFVWGLDPGTRCSVNITTHVGNQTGNVTKKQLDYTTNEIAPKEVSGINITTQARSLEVTWSPPLIPNGVVRKYVVDVLDARNSCLVRRTTFLCTDCSSASNPSCDDEHAPDVALPKQDCEDSSFVNKTGTFSQSDSYSHTIEGLHPFRNYSVEITPYTRCFGETTSEEGETKQDAPDGAPRTVSKLEDETTHDTLAFSWLPPEEDLRNGIIINYTITIMYYNRTCYTRPLDKIVNETYYVSNVNSNGINKYVLRNRFPYWQYNVSVAAWTEIGEGHNSSAPKLMMTNQTVPGPISNSPTTTNVSQSSIILTWKPPCLINGIIDHYQINVISEDSDNVKVAKRYPKTTSNVTSYEVESLYPFHNYTFSVAAVNVFGDKGLPVNTTEITRTKTGKPCEPTNVTAIATSSSNITVQWVLPSLYTGVTNYTIIATDDDNHTIEFSTDVVNNFYQTEAYVHGLDEYWFYTVQVVATTSAGNTTSLPSNRTRTLPSVPGVVENVNLHNETNVTLPRVIKVTWEQPTTRNLNGILTSYFVTYMANIDGEVINKTINISANMNTGRKNTTITNIKPGTYTVVVYAATVQGHGMNITKDITIYPGAPLVIESSTSAPLMKKSNDTSAVNDSKTQIAVHIPLNFLCDDSNGTPDRFGIIIAANTEASNDTYIGDTEGFSNLMKQKYKSWFEVQNQTNPKPYITSHSKWNPCQGFKNGARKRRSTTTEVFVIGADGKCARKSNLKYCNGELRPGTSYRFKAFICTKGGCTETRYSETVETQKAEKLLQVEPKSESKVPVIIGAVSASVVFILVVIVLIQMRRRQTACFAKKAEEGNTHRRSEPIPATEMSRVDRPTSVKYKPESVRLSEFPEHVDRLKKDSLLIFSEIYKLLKESSPNHSCSVAESQICRPKNRYTNILPFDHSRVKILPLDDEDGSDYINANYIPGYNSRREYIATQGPMPATFDDFWRMVWEQNVEIIVMLTKLKEKGRNKCDKYWPNQGEPQFYGDLSVSIISESNLSDYTIRIMEIKLKGEKRRVKQFSFLKWPDMGCPEYPESLLEFVKSVRQHESKTNRDRPIIVHCSAGVGRTGTFIAVDHLLQHIRDHDDIDVYNLVLEMRNNRCNMVQTEDQYVYIHECIREFITNDDEEDYDDDDDHLYANTRQENVYENTGFAKQF